MKANYDDRYLENLCSGCGGALRTSPLRPNINPATIITYAGNDAIFAGAGKPATRPTGESELHGFDAQATSTSPTAASPWCSRFGGYWRNFRGRRQRPEQRGGDGGLAVGASLGNPQGLAFDLSVISISRTRRTLMSGKWIPTDHHHGGQRPGQAVSRETEGWQRKPCSTADRIAIDKAGNLYIAEFANNRIRMSQPALDHLDHCRHRPTGYSATADRHQCHLHLSTGVAVDSSGNVYVADSDNCAIARSTPADHQHGRGVSVDGGDNGPATKAQIRAHRRGRRRVREPVYRDTGNERIRYVSASGIITTIAEPVRWLQRRWLVGYRRRAGRSVAVAPDASGAVTWPTWRTTAFAASWRAATCTFAERRSRPAMWTSTQARLDNPMSVAVDSSESVHCRRHANRVRKVTPSAHHTLAGNARRHTEAITSGTPGALNRPTQLQ